MLRGKKVLLGVTGSIAAYKSALIVRELVKAGAEIRVVMTPDAQNFIPALTLSTLSKNPVCSEYVSNAATGQWANHVELGNWADLVLIAPCTANTLAKMASGLCDNLLMAVYLSARCPVAVAPAMDLDMYKHPSTQSNLQKIGTFGNAIIAPGEGELASGLFGVGRLAEVETILHWVLNFFQQSNKLKGKRVLITAGPTYEPIDPVRFIGNRSSGKMGFALAEEALALGADVTLVTGPVQLQLHHPSLKRIDVETAEEMHKQVQAKAGQADIIIMSAAVADYTPREPASQKIKKQAGQKEISLLPTKDILAEVGKKKRKGQLVIGFALETENGEGNAKKKLQNKNLDLIVLNSLSDPGAGFNSTTNKVTLLTNDTIRSFELKTKTEVAKDIWEQVLEMIIRGEQ